VKKNRILLVDDEKGIRDEFIHIFENTKYELETAASSVVALEKIKKLKYDLAILDIRMPDLKNRFSETAGIELLKWLTINKPKLPVIMLSVIKERKIADNALKLGAADYILKDGGNQSDLIEAVNAIMKSHTDRAINVLHEDHELLRIENAKLNDNIKDLEDKLNISIRQNSEYKMLLSKKYSARQNLFIFITALLASLLCLCAYFDFNITIIHPFISIVVAIVSFGFVVLSIMRLKHE
jgi:DNA-binding NarL/FixJ family response regulator